MAQLGAAGPCSHRLLDWQHQVQWSSLWSTLFVRGVGWIVCFGVVVKFYSSMTTLHAVEQISLNRVKRLRIWDNWVQWPGWLFAHSHRPALENLTFELFIYQQSALKWLICYLFGSVYLVLQWLLFWSQYSVITGGSSNQLSYDQVIIWLDLADWLARHFG